jgi:hypothetical protein
MYADQATRNKSRHATVQIRGEATVEREVVETVREA